MSEFTERLRDYGLTSHDHEIIHDRRVVDEAVNIIDTMERALRLHVEYESLPADRGGKNGPKSKAWSAFVATRDYALSRVAS